MADDLRSGPGLRLVSDRPTPSDFESFDRFAVRPRYRQRALAPWQPKRKRRERPDAPGQGKR
jgi:hypothetical protein